MFNVRIYVLFILLHCKLPYSSQFPRFLPEKKQKLFNTRTKTSIRYAKDNDREKRERERKVEGEI